MKKNLTNKQAHNKFVNSFKKSAKIKECFCYDEDKCVGDIISAHSIQKNGKLSLLEESLNGQKVIYSFLNLDFNENGEYTNFKPLGKNEASTFYGFCKYHDTELFKEIETKSFNLEDDKHCFLASYRSFAHEYHVKKEVLKGYQTCNEYIKKFPANIIETMQIATKLCIRDMEKVKKRLNNILKTKDFSNLHYFKVSYNGLIPIACSTSFSPEYSYTNKLLNKSDKTEVVYENVILTVLPSVDKTDVIFACLPEDNKSILFIDEISKLKGLAKDIAISSIIIAYAENTFISPFIIDKMTFIDKKNLLNEIKNTIPDTRQLYSGFIKCKTNLFDSKFIKNKQ